MDRKLIEAFLLKALVSANKKTEYYSNHNVWNSIYRAHRDVLTGRFNLQKYCSESDFVTNDLYEIIVNYNKAPIYSEALIIAIQKDFPEVEFGAIQKLVNMTLKYLIIINECTNESIISIDESRCDCPVDSIILRKLKEKHMNNPIHTPWTRMEEKEYEIVQREIKEYLITIHQENQGNILFDFLYW